MKVIYIIVLLTLLTACSTVKDVGVGMSTAAPAVSQFGSALGAGGLILDIGADIFRLNPTGDEIIDKAAAVWKGHGIVASSGLEAYVSGFKGINATTDPVLETIEKVKVDVKSGRFSGQDMRTYLATMANYDKKHWIEVDYATKNTANVDGLVLRCNREAKNCILSLKGEKVPLPALNEKTVAVHNMLGGKIVNVGEFKAFEPNLKSRMCRLADPIRSLAVNGAATFADIPRLMLVKQMKDANALDADAPITLTGYLKSLELSTTFSGKWEIALDIMSSNGSSMSITEKYDFKTAFGGQAACRNAQDALGSAMQELVDKIIKDPNFHTLLEVSDAK